MIVELIRLIGWISKAYTLLIIARVILSWVNVDPGNRLVNLVFRLTEPVLRPVRQILPNLGGLDLSPILVLFGIQVVEQLLVSALVNLAM